MVNRTGYTGEEGVELLCMAEDAGALWDAVLARGVVAVRARRARHAAPRGLLPAARQRHRAGDRRDLGRARLGVRARQGVHRRRGAARGQGRRARARLVAFVMEEKAIPRQRDADRGGGEVTSGTHSPMLDVGIGMGYVPAAQRGAGDRTDDRRPRQAAPRARRQEADLQEGGRLSGSRRELPDDLRYHPEHDWARVEGDEAVLGITWFARTRSASSSTSSRPRRRDVSKDRRTARSSR